MNSEKVKEITKALECCTTEELLHPCEECPYTNDCKCEVTLHTNILTLINELESENERVRKTNDQFFKVDFVRYTNTIAELEKQNAKLLDSVETVQSNRCVYKCVLAKEHLTMFAEMLKEKFVRQEERFATDVTRFENDLSKVNDSDLPTAKFLIGKATGQATMAEKAQYYIDETLKEFIDR